MLLDPEILKKTGVFALVSGELLACVGGGYWLGRELDKRWYTSPWLMAGLAGAGLVFSVWRIHNQSKRWFRKP